MQISFKHNFIFIHIPKTAGSSITQYLNEYLTEEEKTLSQKFPSHATAQMIQDKLGEIQYNKMFKFAFVRNPWEHQFSLYNYILRAPFHPSYSKVSQCKCFSEYVYNVLDNDPQPCQKDYLISPNLDKVIVDFIGRFENINLDFQKICYHLNLPQRPLPFINKNPITSQSYFEHYTPDLINLIGKKFQKDIEYFVYKFPFKSQEKEKIKNQEKRRNLESIKYQLKIKKRQL
ncbi:sulfotransferase family 2 domain-containing protein [Crocosphaera sp.]|uniref:sulfotransferase family 2 domain-containing protein n=1 Tax=Crocosphaera sp. TaxID=2729996 RepID=UPI00262D9925|nr:sulfotransferase family 2 domain-containing protein [Crocosphaera sp.]MDJ0581302.1 sulfotransferase family 2 domain-containing protein [Crocosphaera sp.]